MTRARPQRFASAARGLLASLALLAAGCSAATGRGDGSGPGGDGAVRVLPERIDGKNLLSADAAKAIVAGAGKLTMIGADVASEGDRIGGFVEIPEGSCALAMARTTATISDTDLYAFEDDGDTFAADESPDAEPAVLLCPPQPRRLYVVARVMSGAGVIALGVQTVPRAAADAVARAVEARGRPGQETGRLEAWPGLESKVNAHRATLGARWEDVKRMAVPVDPHVASRVGVTVEPNRCLDVLVTPSDEVPALEVVVEDAGGRVVARARDRGRDRSLLLCSSSPLELTAVIRPRGSAGLVAVVVGRSAVGAEAELAGSVRVERVFPTLDLPDARAEHERGIAGRGFGAAKTVATGSARVGVRTSFPVELPAGCARLDVVGGKPAASIAAELWDEQGTLVSEGRGGAAAALFVCGPARRARADVEALARPGPIAVELRADKVSPPALVAEPLAAARLLGRLHASGEVTDAARAAAARPITLEAGKLTTLPLVLTPSGCLEVLVALGGGGSGLDLRLVEQGAREATVTRARWVVSDRICSSNGKAASAELRLGSGKATALFLVRPTP